MTVVCDIELHDQGTCRMPKAGTTPPTPAHGTASGDWSRDPLLFAILLQEQIVSSCLSSRDSVPNDRGIIRMRIKRMTGKHVQIKPT